MFVGERSGPATAGHHVLTDAIVGAGFSRTFRLFSVMALCWSQLFAAQRGRQSNSGEKPAVDVVQSVGCVERRDGNPETWWLTKAVDPRVAQPGIFSTGQIETARGGSLGANTFQLVGVADFLDTEGLLKAGRRREFTTPQNANATGEIRPGRKVLVKGMFITSGETKRINLLNVIGLADSCS
jgi:hypothetical protein